MVDDKRRSQAKSQGAANRGKNNGARRRTKH